MKQLTNPQKKVIRNSIVAYINNILRNTDDSDASIDLLNKIKNNNQVDESSIPAALKENISQLIEYLYYFKELNPELADDFNEFVVSIIDERLVSLQEGNAKFGKDSSIQNDLPLTKVLIDSNIIQDSQSIKKVNEICYKKLQDESTFEQLIALLKNEKVRSLLSQEVSLSLFIFAITSHESIESAVSLFEDKGGELYKKGFFSTNNIARYGFELIRKYIQAISLLDMHPCVNSKKFKLNNYTYDSKKLEDFIDLVNALNDQNIWPLLADNIITLDDIIGDTYINIFQQYSNNTRPWGKVKTLELVSIISNESVKFCVRENLITKNNLAVLKPDEILTIAAYLSNPDVKKSIDDLLAMGIPLKFDNIKNIADLKKMLSLLSENKQEISKLFQEKIIEEANFLHLCLNDESNLKQQLRIIRRGAPFFRKKILSIDFIDPQNKYDIGDTITCLEQVSVSVIEFIEKNELGNEITLLLPEGRKLFLEALEYREVQNLISSENVRSKGIIDIWDFEDEQKALMLALDDDAIYQYAKNISSSHNFYNQNSIVAPLLSIGKLLSNPIIFPLYKNSLLNATNIINNPDLHQPKYFVILAKYNALQKLKSELDNPLWKSCGRGFFGKKMPDGINKLNLALQSLDEKYLQDITEDEVKEFTSQVETIHTNVINILGSKQMVYSGLGKREEDVAKFYKEKYTLLTVFKNAALMQDYYHLGLYHFKNENNDEAYKCFTKVLKSDSNYLDALYKASEILIAKKDYLAAKELLEKGQVSAKHARKEDMEKKFDLLITENTLKLNESGEKGSHAARPKNQSGDNYDDIRAKAKAKVEPKKLLVQTLTTPLGRRFLH